jgi:hypothetical protein
VSVARKDVLVMWRVGGPAACILDQGFPARLAFFPPPPDAVCRTQLRSLTAEAVWEPRASNQGMSRLNHSSCIPAARRPT